MKPRRHSFRQLLSHSQTRPNLCWTLTLAPTYRDNFWYSAPVARSSRGQTSPPHCQRQQEVDWYPGKIWSSQIGNVRCVLFHRQKSQLFMSMKVHFTNGQSSTVVVENLFNRSSSHWSMNNSTREVPLPSGTPTTYTTSQCRWFV